MGKPRLTPQQIAQVSCLVAQYIAGQRERYASRAIPLSIQQRVAMDGSLSPHLLDDTRVLMLQANGCSPRFLPDAEELGLQRSARPVRNDSDYVCDVVVL